MRQLRSYQEKAIKAILNEKRLLLCLDMGLGKTISCLVAITKLISEGKINKVLIVAPKYVATKTWPEEIDDPVWAHIIEGLTYSVISGTPKQRQKAVEKDVDIYIINKENIVWYYENYSNKKIDMLIWDESSSLKAAKNKTATGNITRYKAGLEISKACEYAVLLSGTPTPNGLEDIYGQSQFIKEGLLENSKYKFMMTFFNNVSYTKDFPIWKARKGSTEIVVNKLGNKMYQLKSEDVLELPEAVYTVRYVDLNKNALKLYDDMKTNSIITLPQCEIASESAGVKFGKLHQISAGGLYYKDENDKEQILEIHDDKIKEVKDIYDENDAHMIVFYYYKHEAQQIKKVFGKDANFVSEKNLELFKNGELKVLFAQPAQIGHGLNIQTGGNVIIWLSLPASLELYQQANKRLHRSGQTASTVHIMHMISTRIDKDIYDLLNAKGQTQDSFIKALKSLKEIN